MSTAMPPKTLSNTDTSAKPELMLRDRYDLETLTKDRFQSPRARKRAAALLLLVEGLGNDVVCQQTGLLPRYQLEMVQRFMTQGLLAAIFGSERRPEQRRYNIPVIVNLLKELLNVRPPAGYLTWTLIGLTDEVRRAVPGAENITSETVRQVLKNEMGIKSVRNLKPYWLWHLSQG
jgi:hypothetical protein